jgi:hypothetical protein
MAVLLVSERWSGQGASEDQAARKVRRTFDVVATRPVSGDVLNEIRTASGIPKVGNAHPRITGQYCQTVNVEEAGGPTKWLVTAEYSQTVVGDVTDPLAQPADVAWEVLENQREIDTDLDGNPIASSAGEPYDPPIVETESDPVLVWTKNFATATVTASWLLGWADKTNSASVTVNSETVGIGEALQIGVPRADFVEGREGVSAYWRVTFRIAIRVGGGANAWKRKILDQGYRFLNGSGQLVLATDEAGRPMNQPMLLNGSGGKLTSGSPVFRTFRTKGTKAFMELGLT